MAEPIIPALTGDPRLDALYAAHRLCDGCGAQRWTQLAQDRDALLCDDCASNAPAPEEEEYA